MTCMKEMDENLEMNGRLPNLKCTDFKTCLTAVAFKRAVRMPVPSGYLLAAKQGSVRFSGQ